MRPILVLLLTAAMLAGCATARTIEKRVAHGPTAEDVFKLRSYLQAGREPSFEEALRWRDLLDHKISRYLHEHPEVANSFDVQTFRYSRQVAVGMTKEQVRILFDSPDRTVKDASEMEKLARRFWPSIKDKATEVWVYPGGWYVYFSGDDRVVDITQYVARGRSD